MKSLPKNPWPCSAVKKVDPGLARQLKSFGDPGLVLRRDKKTGEPVLYLWQAFSMFRLDHRQIRVLGRYLRDIDRSRRKKRKSPGR